MKLTFEANSAKELYRQLSDFLDVVTNARATVEEAPKAETAPSVARVAAQEATKTLAPTQPTPAVKALLDSYEVSSSEWPLITRTGKDGRMTQGDVKAYVAGRMILLAPDPAPAAEEPAESAPAAEADEATPAPVIVEDDNTPAKVTTLDDVRNALKSLYEASEDGRTTCLDLLSRFGVKKVGELPEAQYANFIRRATGALNGEAI